MSELDIVARLELRAEQFSSETGKSFASIKSLSKSAASEVRSNWNETFAEVQRLASSATQAMQGQGVSIGGDVASIRASIAAQEQRAETLRQVAVAAEQASRATGVDAQTLLRQADAASVASIAAEQHTNELRQQLVNAEALETELRRLNTTQGAVVVRQNGVVASAAQQRTAFQQLGFQVQDFAVQVSAGGSVATAFSQQLSQATYAISMMGGKMSGVAAFLGSGWGIALTVALTALAPLAAKMLDTSSAADAAKKSTEDLANSVDSISVFFDTVTGKAKAAAEATIQYAIAARNAKMLGERDRQREATETGNRAVRASLRDLTDYTAGAPRDFRMGGPPQGRATVNRDVADVFSGDFKGNRDLRLRQIAESGSSNAALARTILEQRAQFADSAKKIAQSDAEVRSLLTGVLDPSLRTDKPKTPRKKKSRGSSEDTSGMRAFAEAQASLAVADTDVEKAEAQLKVTRAQAAADLKSHKITQEEYTARIAAGKQAVDAAKAATKDAAVAQREYNAALSGLEGKYDPAAAAARRYKDELAEIAKLQSPAAGAGPAITDEQAARFAAGARAAYMRSVLPAPSGDGGISKKLADDERYREESKRQAEQDFRELSDYYFDLFSGRTDDIWRRFKSLALGTIADSLAKSTLNDLLGVATPGKGKTGDDPATTELRKINGGLDRLGIKLPKDIGKTLIEGAGVGMIAGGVFGGITGGKQSQLGGAVGGALGEVAGKALGKSLGGLLGQAGGPLGAIAGGILGSAIGGLFKKTKSGSATLSIDNGSVGVGGTSGNSSSYRAAASGLAGGVGDSLTRIADALGGSLTGPIGVSIGKRKDSFVVDTTGRGKTKGAGTQKFDTEEAAIRAAISNALADGAIQGISDASKRILASGQKLETAIEKASMIEAIPKQLMAMLDPVGAALDELNEKWAKTVAALKEGGATTEQMAQAEQLYRLQLAETKATTQAASASLKDFLKSLSIGSNSPLSLRDQETAALSALQPFLVQIDAGQRIDQDKYREAAQAYLDIERQLGGSTDRYFEQFSRIQDYTNRAIAAIDNAVPIREAKPDPFAQATASNTGTANELLAQISEQLRAIAEGGGGGGGGVLANAFIGGSPRGFANAA